MTTIISSLIGLITILLSIIGYGNIFNINRRDNDLFFTIIVGYFIIGFITLFLHFFIPISNYVSLSVSFIGIVLLFVSRFNILEFRHQ